MENKKGMSAIVATLVIILLAIVAFGIVSVVVKQTVSKGAEGIELSSKCLDIEIHASKVVPSLDNDGNAILGTYDVTLTRSAAGDFPIDGVDLVFTDAEDENSVRKDRIKENIQPFDKFTEQVELNEFVPAKVTVVPFFKTKDGSLHYCDNSQTFVIQ